jgi:hypothetical protein
MCYVFVCLRFRNTLEYEKPHSLCHALLLQEMYLWPLASYGNILAVNIGKITSFSDWYIARYSLGSQNEGPLYVYCCQMHFC